MYPVAFLRSKDVNNALFCSRECLKVVLNKYFKDVFRYKWEVKKDDLVVKLSRRKNSDLFNAINDKKNDKLSIQICQRIRKKFFFIR